LPFETPGEREPSGKNADKEADSAPDSNEKDRAAGLANLRFEE
jgi:hypothetical protein